MQKLNRLTPRLPVTAVKTYAIKQNFRKASCVEFQCSGWRDGWSTLVDVSTEVGTNHAIYIRVMSKRAFTEERVGDNLIRFHFKPGQQCFKASDHQVPVESPPLYIVKDGDWRGNPRGTAPVRRREQDWVEDFALHQQSLADKHKQG